MLPVNPIHVIESDDQESLSNTEEDVNHTERDNQGQVIPSQAPRLSILYAMNNGQTPGHFKTELQIKEDPEMSSQEHVPIVNGEQTRHLGT